MKKMKTSFLVLVALVAAIILMFSGAGFADAPESNPEQEQGTPVFTPPVPSSSPSAPSIEETTEDPTSPPSPEAVSGYGGNTYNSYNTYIEGLTKSDAQVLVEEILAVGDTSKEFDKSLRPVVTQAVALGYLKPNADGFVWQHRPTLMEVIQLLNVAGLDQRRLRQQVVAFNERLETLEKEVSDPKTGLKNRVTMVETNMKTAVETLDSKITDTNDWLKKQLSSLQGTVEGQGKVIGGIKQQVSELKAAQAAAKANADANDRRQGWNSALTLLLFILFAAFVVGGAIFLPSLRQILIGVGIVMLIALTIWLLGSFGII